MDMSGKAQSEPKWWGKRKQGMISYPHTCDLETLHAIHVEARIDHTAFLTKLHGTRTKLKVNHIMNGRFEEKEQNDELTECHVVATAHYGDENAVQVQHRRGLEQGTNAPVSRLNLAMASSSASE